MNSWDWFVKRLYYISGDFKDPELYNKLEDTLAQAEKGAGHAGQLPFLSRHQPGIFPGRGGTARRGRADRRGRTANGGAW